MRIFLLFLLLSGFTARLFAQAMVAPDTLIKERFDFDPTNSMLPIPSGNDLEWVNYDADGDPAAGELPGNWFWDSDLGDSSANASNTAFTSSSYLDLPLGVPSHNRNWLILSPIFIPDSSYWLCWRSLSFQGPAYLDGYKVLVSNTLNTIESFDHTLFQAAQMLEALANPTSLDLDDYSFSPGYIHANGFTNPDYFFTVYDTFPNGSIVPLYRGKFEPHTLRLDAYAGQQIYLAFLHDSDDDNLLQLDDIVIASDKSSGVSAPANILSFHILNNPSHEAAYFTWKLKAPQELRLVVTNNQGIQVSERTIPPGSEGSLHLDVQHWAAGLYYCSLQSAEGQITKKLLKW